MKGTDNFKKEIQEYLNHRAYRDPLFGVALGNPKKSIDECVTYILSTVQKSGQNGFSDDEVFGMAVHYYDETDIEVGKMPNGDIVINHQVRLTDEEIAEAKQKAIDEVVAEQKARMTKKPKVSKEKSLDPLSGNTLF